MRHKVFFCSYVRKLIGKENEDESVGICLGKEGRRDISTASAKLSCFDAT